jgi:WD40 repeat protein
MDGWTTQVAMPSNGQYIAVFSANEYDLANTGISFFDISGKKLWQSQTRDISTMEISSDGQYIAANCNNVDICLFDHSGNKLWQHPIGNYIYCISISGDGQNIVFLSYRNLSLYDRSGSIKWYKAAEDFSYADISSDGKYIAACSNRNKSVYLFDSNGTKLWQYQVDGHADSVAISSDGKYVASGGLGRNVYLFDRNGNKLWQYETAGDIREVVISPDGRYVAARDLNNNIYLFDRNGNKLWRYETESRLQDIALSADGRYVSAVGLDNNVFLIGSNGTKLWQYNASDSTYAMTMSSDGQYVAFGCADKNLYILINPAYDANSTVIPSINKSPQPSIPAVDNNQSLTISPSWKYDTGDYVAILVMSTDGKHIASGSYTNNSIYFFDRNESLLWRSEVAGDVMAIAQSDDGRNIVAAGRKDLSLFDMAGNKKWQYTGNFGSATISKDGKYIAATNGSLLFFDLNGSIKWQYQSNNPISGTAISGDGQYIIAVDADGSLFSLDPDGKILWQNQSGGQIYYIAISEDGQYIAVSSNDKNVYLFDRNGNKIWQYLLGAYNSVAMSGDGQYIAIGSTDHYVYLFDRAGNKIWQYHMEEDVGANYVSISGDGQYIVAGSTDNNVYIFNRSGKILWQNQMGVKISNVVISNDGQYIAVGCGNNNVYLYVNQLISANSAVTPSSDLITDNIGGFESYYPFIILIIVIIIATSGGFAIVIGRGRPRINVILEVADVREGEEAFATVNVTTEGVSAPIKGIVRLSGSDINTFGDPGAHKIPLGKLATGVYSVTVVVSGKDNKGNEVRKNVEHRFTVKPAVPKVKLEALPLTCVEGEPARATVRAMNLSENTAFLDSLSLGKDASVELFFDVNTMTVGEHSKKVTINYRNVAGREFSGHAMIKYTVQPAEPVIEAHVDSIDIVGSTGIASTTLVNRSDHAAKLGNVTIGKGETHMLNFDLDASTPGSHEKVVKLQYTNRAGRPFEKELTIAYTVHGQEAPQQAVAPAVTTPVPDGSVLKDKLVFISYATKDKNIADAVCHSLEQQKIRCWIAPRDVLPGMVFEKAIIKSINDSDIFIIIYSSFSNQSPHVENEVREAWRTGIPIIPFRIEDVPMSEVLRYYISSKHWLDAMTPPLQQHIDDLTRTVQVLLAAQ